MKRAQRSLTIAARRRDVARLYVQGMHQADIAKRLGVTQQLISLDIKAIHAEWRHEAVRTYDVKVDIEEQKLFDLERTYREAWERSLLPREVSHTKAVEGDRARREASVQKEQRPGDPRFLDGIRQCIADRRELLGLDAAKRVEIDLDSLSDAQLLQLAQRARPEDVVRQPGMAQA